MSKHSLVLHALNEPIEKLILIIRGQKVLLDSDLARLYGVETRALNQAVKRNVERFPSDFMFQLTFEEAEGCQRSRFQSGTLKEKVGESLVSRSQIVTGSSRRKSNPSQIVIGSQKHRDPRFLPYAFTQEGISMLSSVLRSPIAVHVNIAIMRAFVRLREMVGQNKELAVKLSELERKITNHDEDIKNLFLAIRELMTPPESPKRKIGFHA